MGKRILLFVLTNILVMATITIVMNLLGVGPYISQYGLNYESLAIFCLLWGFGGAFISLLMSKMMAKWMMGVQIIDPTQATGDTRWLLDTVDRLARNARIQKTPEVGIYDSPDVNAFATGPSKNNSLVAVSSGMLRTMNRSQVEGVLGHEIAHVANGDMVTMTLVQGVVNSFVMFFSRIIAFALSQNVREESRRMVMFITTIVLDILFSILGSIVVAAFSRYREFRADEGGAQLAGRQKMIDALKGLKQQFETTSQEDLPEESAAFSSMKISGRNGLLSLFSTHPDLDLRIKRLQEASGNPVVF